MPDSSVPLPDLAWLRLVVSVLAILVGGSLVTVGRLHWKAWHHLRRVGARVAGLIPLHVALVASGVLLLELTLAWGLLEQLRVQASAPTVIVRTVLYGVASLLILVSLVVVGRVQRRRVQFERGCVEGIVAKGESEDEGGPRG